MVVISEWMDNRSFELVRQIPRPCLYEPDLWAKPVQLADALKQAEALVVRNNTRVTVDLVDQAPHLKVVGRLGVGLDNIDLNACLAHRVCVVYARGANAIPVVEYVLGALLYGIRPWIDWSDETKHGAWQRTLGGQELHGKTLAIIGLGDIGSRVARAAHMLGMAVEAFDPHLTPFHALIADGTVTPMTTLEELVERSDALTLHAPLRPETYHILNHKTMARFKPGSILVNTARGGLIDEMALADFLERGRLGAVFLDVREHEPPSLPDRLAQFTQVKLTPHLAGLTDEATWRTASLVLEDVARILTGRLPLSPVRLNH